MCYEMPRWSRETVWWFILIHPLFVLKKYKSITITFTHSFPVAKTLKILHIKNQSHQFSCWNIFCCESILFLKRLNFVQSNVSVFASLKRSEEFLKSRFNTSWYMFNWTYLILNENTGTKSKFCINIQ